MNTHKAKGQPLVVHCKRNSYDVYIGRPSKWGNPFVIGRDGDRATVISKYRGWLLARPELVAALHELRGKVLGCWCAPLACHGEVLAELANTNKLQVVDMQALSRKPVAGVAYDTVCDNCAGPTPDTFKVTLASVPDIADDE